MRTFVLLFVLALPALLSCSLARAAASGDLGKPVCTHYDDSASKATDAHASTAASGSANPGAAAPSSASLGASARSGGSPSELHGHNAPRWQAFLPGMFR